MAKRKPRTARLQSLWIAGFLLLTACASAPPRTEPLPQELYPKTTVLGIENARTWADEAPDDIHTWYELSDEEYRAHFSEIMGGEHIYLALSGGGENGAFTAGLLAGWTAAGDRPEFTLVTGISTGALIAPYAFLGPDYDETIKEVYTNYAADDLARKRRPLQIIRNDAMMESTPMKAVIDHYMTPEVMEKIAVEHRKGRMLFIGTTNLDAARPVIWDIGEIAISGHPDALELIRKIQLASASIPVGLPPVMIEVEAGGKSFEEMHVDGGVTQQVFLYPLSIDWRRLEKRFDLKGGPKVYIIRNAHLRPRWVTVKRKLAPIAGRTIDSLIRTQGIGDIYRMYIGTLRDGMEFNLAFIPTSFSDTLQGQSGVTYMRQLYAYAFSLAKDGYPWESKPPGMELPSEQSEP